MKDIIEFQILQIEALQQEVERLKLALTLATIKVIDPIFLKPIQNK
mgnify:CR=1 FL=1|jgi:hypothetical protein